MRLVRQPDWDARRASAVGIIRGCNGEGHYEVEMAAGGGGRRVLGLWWLEAAEGGAVDALPLVNAV